MSRISAESATQCAAVRIQSSFSATPVHCGWYAFMPPDRRAMGARAANKATRDLSGISGVELTAPPVTKMHGREGSTNTPAAAYSVKPSPYAPLL